jgi:hypothetical protein
VLCQHTQDGDLTASYDDILLPVLLETSLANGSDWRWGAGIATGLAVTRRQDTALHLAVNDGRQAFYKPPATWAAPWFGRINMGAPGARRTTSQCGWVPRRASGSRATYILGSGYPDRFWPALGRSLMDLAGIDVGAQNMRARQEGCARPGTLLYKPYEAALRLLTRYRFLHSMPT